MSVYRKLLVSEEIPLPVRKEYRRIGEGSSGEHMLFIDMTARSVLDAFGITGISDPVKHNKEVSESRHWFESGKTLKFFFELAGIDLGVVRPCVLAAPITCYMEIPDDKKYPANR